MATHHASAGEVVDLDSWAQDVPGNHSKAIVKTDDMEIARLVILAGKEFSDHKVPGVTVLHCIKGKIEIKAMGTTRTLSRDQLLYLAPGESHSVTAMVDSIVLLTIIFKF